MTTRREHLTKLSEEQALEDVERLLDAAKDLLERMTNTASNLPEVIAVAELLRQQEWEVWERHSGSLIDAQLDAEHVPEAGDETE